MMKNSTLLYYFNLIHPEKIEIRRKILSPADDVYKAPDRCVNHILNFARSYRVEETKSAGQVELILN
ncbi:MAG TPA: hypothetical protein PLK12_14125 [Prolixibacteraceae bacterium]|nr:hypothetical protein [Prolixibacteraceae bacterium]